MTTQTHDELRGWLTGRLPQDWFTGPVEVTVDREEITVVGTLEAPATSEGASAAEQEAAVSGRIKEFRERTRDQRIEVALELEHRARRKVSWGVHVGDRRELFTTLSVPTMTRLRQADRQVLDTLVDAGVAKSRSDALAWCVRLTGTHTDAWLSDLRTAMEGVAKVRAEGPAA
jgi:hypothetical protein